MSDNLIINKKGKLDKKNITFSRMIRDIAREIQRQEDDEIIKMLLDNQNKAINKEE